MNTSTCMTTKVRMQVPRSARHAFVLSWPYPVMAMYKQPSAWAQESAHRRVYFQNYSRAFSPASPSSWCSHCLGYSQ